MMKCGKFGAVLLLVCIIAATAAKRPHIVFLHDESTDGRLYREGTPVPIPNIQSLRDRGVNFLNHYVNVPICAPSRSSMWSGRQPHNIPHEHNDIVVGGAWNNYEGVGVNGSGLGVTENDLFHVKLADSGYNVKIAGKTDWVAGGHSLTTMVDSWTLYTRFPYSFPDEGGWHIWGDCGGNLTVNSGNKSAHEADWKFLDENLEWLQEQSTDDPIFLYQGFNIVHPPYSTSQEYLDRIDVDKIEAPHWPPLETLHPCDLQTVGKKGCALPGGWQNTTEHKKAVISGYYAMIAEYDDMVGKYIQAVEAAGLMNDTIFVLSSDHGDMQMQHQQFYKMVPYEASSHVPLIISGPGVTFQGTVSQLTSHVDMAPTFLDLAGVPIPSEWDGQSLVPFLQTGQSPNHPESVIAQFHGENLVMSWYMIVKGDIKYVAFGTGKQNVPQMWNLTADPDEYNNLALDPAYSILLQSMDAALRKQVDYPKVSMEVATYNIEMAKWWVSAEPNWQGVLNGTMKGKLPGHPSLNPDWGTLWQLGSETYFDAWNKWIAGPPEVLPCLSNLTYNWPPASN